jgi:NADH:ubiquinone oxidoreductase subunit F (NADH-binding)
MTAPPLVPARPGAPLGGSSADPAWLLPEPVRVPAAGLGAGLAPQDLGRHLTEHGPRRSASDLLSAVEDIGLTGRGGGHFPVAGKWRTAVDAARRSGRAPLVVANGAEGEPASAKDQVLLATRPHLVLDGLADTAEAVGAHETVLWLHGDAHLLHRTVLHAVAERRAAGLREPQVRLVSAPAHYLAGESSAVVHGLSGGPALPTSRHVPAAVAGVDGRPTLVHNVETLARTALLARTGTAGHCPTALVTVLTGESRTVVEVDSRAPLRVALLLGGWPLDCEPQAVLVGGYGGSWLPWHRAADLELSPAALHAAGTSLGAGVLAPLAPGACGVAEAARLAAYLARSSARQCGPCVFGLAALADTLAQLRTGSGRRADVDRLRRWAGEVDGRGACHHPDGAVRMVLSALVTFDRDVEAHRRHRPCDGALATPLLPIPVGP